MSIAWEPWRRRQNGFREGVPSVEYPTLTILMIALAVAIVPMGSLIAFYLVTSAMLLVCFVITILATARPAGTRTWDVAMVAFAPSVLLVGTLNWDLPPRHLHSNETTVGVVVLPRRCRRDVVVRSLGHKGHRRSESRFGPDRSAWRASG